MLGQMVGRITSKPGGKAEMGEVSLWKFFFTPYMKLELMQKSYELMMLCVMYPN